jgi:hypothetical protein
VDYSLPKEQYSAAIQIEGGETEKGNREETSEDVIEEKTKIEDEEEGKLSEEGESNEEDEGEKLGEEKKEKAPLNDVSEGCTLFIRNLSAETDRNKIFIRYDHPDTLV